MIALELISYDVPPLKLSDSGTKALDWMEEFKISAIPVIQDNKYKGLISEADILDGNDPDEKMVGHEVNFKKVSANQHQHLFDVVAVMVENDVDVLPIIDENETYLGLITTKKVVQSFAKIISVVNKGSIITLELNINDYSLSEIARLVESDDAKILTSFVTSHSDSTKLEVTLKVNKTDITRILKTFERFNYVITASFNESEYYEDLKTRYNQFMRFLNP